MAGSGAAQIVAFVSAPVITRYFPPEEFGSAAIFLAITSIIGVIACFTYEQAITLPSNEVDAGSLYWLCIFIALGVAVIICIGILLKTPSPSNHDPLPPQIRFPFSKALFWHYPHYSNQGGTPNGTIRDGDWKLIEWYEDGALELYNIPQDIGEKNNLATQNPDKAKELHSKLIAWRKEVGALMPTPNSASTSVKNPNKKKRAK